MATPSTRETLKQYALRALGKPVIEINADDDQLEDRINEAVSEAVTKNSVTTNWKEAQGFIVVPESVISVINLFPYSSKGNLNLFDVRYQLRLNDLYDFSSTSIINYDVVLRHLDFLDHILVGEKPLRFNQHDNRLYI